MKKLMQRRDNLLEAVKQAAIRRPFDRDDLWKLVLRAINQGELPVDYPSERLPGGGTITWAAWMIGLGNAVEGDCSPESCGGRTLDYLRMMQVDKTAFHKWLLKATKLPSGPRRGSSGLASSDCKHFKTIKQMIKSGDARSPYGATLKLVLDGKIARKNAEPESIAKRIASRYRQERIRR
jgi:hypothetical protein